MHFLHSRKNRQTCKACKPWFLEKWLGRLYRLKLWRRWRGWMLDAFPHGLKPSNFEAFSKYVNLRSERGKINTVNRCINSPIPLTNWNASLHFKLNVKFVSESRAERTYCWDNLERCFFEILCLSLSEHLFVKQPLCLGRYKFLFTQQDSQSVHGWTILTWHDLSDHRWS